MEPATNRMTIPPDHTPATSGETRSRGQRIGLWLGPLLFALTLLLDLEPGRPEITRMAAVALLMATWWITD
ncbi:MAG: SLC13/DASS family transporter, partial [Gemmatimonadetes bacterium]|nr:SLC13/DASS family transporter [Gemmatimonadota bacterium]